MTKLEALIKAVIELGDLNDIVEIRTVKGMTHEEVRQAAVKLLQAGIRLSELGMHLTNLLDPQTGLWPDKDPSAS